MTGPLQLNDDERQAAVDAITAALQLPYNPTVLVDAVQRGINHARYWPVGTLRRAHGDGNWAFRASHGWLIIKDFNGEPFLYIKDDGQQYTYTAYASGIPVSAKIDPGKWPIQHRPGQAPC